MRKLEIIRRCMKREDEDAMLRNERWIKVYLRKGYRDEEMTGIALFLSFLANVHCFDGFCTEQCSLDR